MSWASLAGKNFWHKNFDKKLVQEVLDYSKTLSMHLHNAKQHLEALPEHPVAPSTTPWRYQQFLKHVKNFYINDAIDLVKEVQMEFLIGWSGPPMTTNDMCYKWP